MRFQRPHIVLRTVLVEIRAPKALIWSLVQVLDWNGEPKVNDDGRVRLQVDENVLQFEVVMHHVVFHQASDGFNQVAERVENAGNDFLLVFSHGSDVIIKIQAVDVGHLHEHEPVLSCSGLRDFAFSQGKRIVASHFAQLHGARVHHWHEIHTIVQDFHDNVAHLHLIFGNFILHNQFGCILWVAQRFAVALDSGVIQTPVCTLIH